MSRTTLFLVGVMCFGFFAAYAAARTIVVKQDGTGDSTMIQAALNAASNGDVIEIGDDETYVEDLTASPVLAQAGLAPPLVSFTLKAADGNHPIVQAANAETSQRMSILGLPGRDMLGFVLWGCNGVTVQGIEFANLENNVNGFGVSASFVIADSANITVENCVIRGPGEPSPSNGSGILMPGVQANPFRVDNITIQNCEITECHYGVVSAVFQKGSGTDPDHVTLEDCRFSDTTESAVDIDNAQEAVVRGCTFNNCQSGIHLAGGNSTVEDCLVFHSKAEGLKADVDENWNDQITGGVIRRCAFIGNGAESSEGGVRCADGASLQFENCIIAGNNGPGVRVTTGSTTDVTVTMDHCDIYENNADFQVSIELDGDNFGNLTVTNTNIVSSSGGGIKNDIEFDAVTSHHNNVFVPGDPYIYLAFTDSVSADPMFVAPTTDPDQFTFEGFALKSGSPVLTAGEGGAVIGSQGQRETMVETWMVH